MRKNVFGRHLKRDTNERKALFKGLISSLVLYEKIKTTEEKAKAVKGQIDKIITRAKKDPENRNSRLDRYLSSEALKKLTKYLVPQLTARTSGYTRIIKLGERFKDNASMVILEWVDTFKSIEKKEEIKKAVVSKKTTVKLKRVRTTKKEKNEK